MLVCGLWPYRLANKRARQGSAAETKEREQSPCRDRQVNDSPMHAQFESPKQAQEYIVTVLLLAGRMSTMLGALLQFHAAAPAVLRR